MYLDMRAAALLWRNYLRDFNRGRRSDRHGDDEGQREDNPAEHQLIFSTERPVVELPVS